MKTLQISSTLTFPLDVVTQTLACIGRRGAGKTYLAQMIAEQMLDAEAQIVAIDAVGNWFGLRVGADGKSKGKDIFIAGGEHGDVPILPESGARFARLVVEKHIPMILDVSGFRQGERKRFAADFGEEFFHLKKTQKSAVHLFIEEAQLFVPQRVGPEEARMLGAFENIIRLGRNYGVGSTMISQRPQSVNKEVLSQVECLCVLQVNGTHERKALEEWVQEAGADRKLVGELPGLGRGEGYVWSPSWLKIFQRVKFGHKTTFDASATPEVGKTARAATLTSMDVATLQADLQEIIAKSDADNPAILRRRIAELERQLRAKPAVSQAPDPKEIEERVKAEVENAVSAMRSHVEDAVRERMHACAAALTEQIDEFNKHAENARDLIRPMTSQEQQKYLTGNGAKSQAAYAPPVTTAPGSLSAPEQRILDAIAWLEDIGVAPAKQPAVAFLAGYTYGAGSYNNARGRLNQGGMVAYLAGNRIQLTNKGRAHANSPGRPGSNEELHARIMAKLPGPEQRLLDPLLKAWPRTLGNATLAERSGYTAGAGSFNNARGRLRSLGLIDYPQPGVCVARNLLFEAKLR